MISTTTASPQTPAIPVASDGWLTQTWRLARWNLFTVRRRMMSKVLLVIALVAFAVVIGAEALTYVAITNAPVSPRGQICATATANGSQSPQCQPLTPQQQQQEEQARQRVGTQVRDGLTFPLSLGLAGGYISFMGVILLCILAGSLIGGEYGFGTIRLMLSHGMGRAQMVVAQVVALAVLALGLAGGILLLGALAGFIVGPSLGATVGAVPGGGWLEFGAYWLAVALNLFVFELVALLIATLGRSVAAGIAASLGYVLLENVVGSILVGVGTAIQSDLGTFLAHIPDWFLGINAANVSVNAAQSPVDLGISTSSVIVHLDTGRALLVTAGYCVLLIGLSYMLVRGRDVTA